MEKQFEVEVEDVGKFVFRRPTMADMSAIGVAYSRFTQGIETPSPWLDGLANAYAQVKTLAIEVPEGWNIDEIDPLEDDAMASIFRVNEALNEKLSFFRRRAPSGREASRPSNGGDGAAVVSPDLPNPAD